MKIGFETHSDTNNTHDFECGAFGERGGVFQQFRRSCLIWRPGDRTDRITEFLALGYHPLPIPACLDHPTATSTHCVPTWHSGESVYQVYQRIISDSCRGNH